MKKIILIALTFCVVIFSGCQTGSGENPKEVLKHFFDSVAKRDFTTAKKYATNDSEGMLSMMQMGMQNMKNEHAERMMNLIQNMEMEDAVVNGDSALVSVKDKKSGETSDFLLKKEKGNWKVAFDMATLMGMANKKMQEHGMRGLDNMGGIIDSAEYQKGTKNQKAQKFMDSIMDSIRAEELKKLK
jgi:hypothetical protein